MEFHGKNFHAKKIKKMFQIVGYDVLLLLVMRENGGSEGRSGEGKFFYMDYV